jgi:DNA-binding MarR family transcriptional regulator
MRSSPSLVLTTAVMATADTLLRESQRFFRPFGLTASQYNVLNVVGPRPDGMSQRELSDVLVVDRSNVTGLLDRMEKCGWVQRADDPLDRRVYRITLTASGRKLWETIAPRYAEVVMHLTRGLTQKQMAACGAVLEQMMRSAKAWPLPRAEIGSSQPAGKNALNARRL